VLTRMARSLGLLACFGRVGGVGTTRDRNLASATWLTLTLPCAVGQPDQKQLGGRPGTSRRRGCSVSFRAEWFGCAASVPLGRRGRPTVGQRLVDRRFHKLGRLGQAQTALSAVPRWTLSRSSKSPSRKATVSAAHVFDTDQAVPPAKQYILVRSKRFEWQT